MFDHAGQMSGLRLLQGQSSIMRDVGGFETLAQLVPGAASHGAGGRHLFRRGLTGGRRLVAAGASWWHGRRRRFLCRGEARAGEHKCGDQGEAAHR
jgi:hypothetical protein